MKRTLIAITILAAAVLLAGCGSFWEDQGAASRTSAEARLRQAEAERQNAQAAIIDAEARGALAQSQARALTTAMDANASLTRQAVALADRGEYVWLGAGLAVLGLVIGGLGVGLAARRPGGGVAPPPAAPGPLVWCPASNAPSRPPASCRPATPNPIEVLPAMPHPMGWS